MTNRHSGQAVITFTYDDGRRNNYDNALPLHEKYGIPATFALISGRLLEKKWWKRHMTPNEVVDASRRGVELASHTMSHREPLTALSDEELEAELQGSKDILSGFLPREASIGAVCVPFSKSDRRVQAKAREVYDFVRVAGRTLNDPIGPSRIVKSHPVTQDTAAAEICAWIDDAIERRKWLVLMLHGVVTQSPVRGAYDTHLSTLEEVLQYVSSRPSDRLLPASFADVQEIRRDARQSEVRNLLSGTRPSQATLAESDGYLITYHRAERPSGKVVISFGGLPSKKTTEGFGSRFILGQGWDHIFVAQAPMTQYQHLSLEEFVEAVSPVLEGSDVFAYGSSLGAYAALYYGGAIDARIISAAPKNSAHPLVLQKRFAHLGFHHQELADTPKSSHPPLVLYDPHRAEESKFIRKLVAPAYPEARFIELPYAGHTVLDTMSKAGELKEFIRSYVDRYEVIDLTLPSAGNAVYHAELGRSLLGQKKYLEALAEFERSNDIRKNAEAGSGIVKALIRLDRLEAAKSAAMQFQRDYGTLNGIPPWAREALERVQC